MNDRRDTLLPLPPADARRGAPTRLGACPREARPFRSRGTQVSSRCTAVPGSRWAVIAIVATVLAGCASGAPADPRMSFDLFLPPDPNDVFYARIRLWQASERLAALRGQPAVVRDREPWRLARTRPVRESDIQESDLRKLDPRESAPGDSARGDSEGASRDAPDPPAPAGAVSGPGPASESDGGALAAQARSLSAALAGFEARRQRRAVEDTLRFVQAQSRRIYRADAAGESWPALEDLLREGRDDCDGLELLTFALLRRQGFGQGEIYRTIVREPQRDLYHMVTLWLPGGGGPDAPVAGTEPWVLDPTGWITRSPAPLSAIRPWRPVRLFDESGQWSAAPSNRPDTHP